MTKAVHVNGKWLSQRLTGTQRYAGEIVRAIIQTGAVDLVVHVPSDVDVPDWLLGEKVTVTQSSSRGVVFEQLYLPWATRGRLLLNFAGPAPLLKKRQLVTMHDATPFRHPQTFTKSFVVMYFVNYFLLGRFAARLVTVSRFSATELDSVLGIPARKFVVAGCAADTLAAVEPSEPDIATALTSPYYLVVGTLARHKNLARSVAALANSGRRVVVVGASGNHQVFTASPLAVDAIVAGALSDAELAWLYRHAAALVFPSKYEGFGIPPLEAQSLGCPVVSSTAASLPEVVGDGGLFFDPDDTDALLAAVARLESDPSLVESLRSRGYANAARFSWRQSAELVLDSVAALS